MGHIDMILTITAGGEVSYIHPVFFTREYPTEEPFVFVSMSDTVNKVAKRIGKEGFTPKATLDSIYHILTTKEEKALALIRNGEFRTIKLTKKDGEIELIHAEQMNKSDNITIKAIEEVISTGKYQKITITQKDGKLVNLTQEVMMKV